LAAFFVAKNTPLSQNTQKQPSNFKNSQKLSHNSQRNIMQQSFFIIGLMSGTSADGIDVALLRTDGVDFVERLGGVTIPYPADFSAQLLQAAQTHIAEEVLVRELTKRHAAAVTALLQQTGYTTQEIDYLGFHGHTIDHAPEERRTLQIGDAGLLAHLTGIDVVYDFRKDDVAAGGQGAPLVPLYHQALAKNWQKPVVLVNIGGVANVTYLDDAELLAFDTGTGNALLNDWMQQKIGQTFDNKGETAKRGQVNAEILGSLLQHPFFTSKPPKSLDRNAFSLESVKNLSLEDGAATLTHFTAQSIALSKQFFPKEPAQWVVVGGGRHNDFLLETLQHAVAATVVTGESVGLQSDFVEAEAFAYLAARSVKGLPLSLPTTTGVPTPLTGGKIVRVNNL
jgi:anhydro-N-acetylmuramic acid kinase